MGVEEALLPASPQACSSPHGRRPQGNGCQSTAIPIITHRHQGPVDPPKAIVGSTAGAPRTFAFVEATTKGRPKKKEALFRCLPHREGIRPWLKIVEIIDRPLRMRGRLENCPLVVGQHR